MKTRARKKETAFDGGKDENVFDIMQGVSINIFVKKKQGVILSEARKGEVEGSLARVYHYELIGKRFEKYAFLGKTSFNDIPWKELAPQAPQYFFVPKDFSVQNEYEKGFKIDELMKVNAFGIVTFRDYFLVSDTPEQCQETLNDLHSLTEYEFRKKYKVEDSRDWTYEGAMKDSNEASVEKLSYRPFDNKYVLYSKKSKGVIAYPRYEIMRNFLEEQNIAINLIRSVRGTEIPVFATKNITDKTIISPKDNANVFPLYLYPTEGEEKLGETRKPNLDEKIWHKIEACLDECHSGGRGPIESMDPIEASPLQGDNPSHKTSPEQVFDYIYGVLHTPSYREKYREFLKIDFPRIPYPENKEEFERIVSIGNKLRKLHLMEEIPPQATSFDIEGDNVVTDVKYEKEIPGQAGNDNYGKVYINKTQYFANVPELAWNFYIGGYQPAQKWLKDRKNRTLTFDDISHYRKIIAILIETHKLMQNLDEIAG